MQMVYLPVTNMHIIIFGSNVSGHADAAKACRLMTTLLLMMAVINANLDVACVILRSGARERERKSR